MGGKPIRKTMTELFGQVRKLDVHDNLVTLAVDESAIYTLQKYHADGKPQVLSIIANDDNEPSPKQRRFAFALINDIWQAQVGGDWLETEESTRHHFYRMYEYYYGLDFGEFSLSAVKGSKTATNQFINMLLDFAASHNIGLSVMPLNELETQEIKNWEYMCLMNKQCVICGNKPSDLHHLDTIGIGMDRTTINHLKHRTIQLCREHHNMAHNMGAVSFLQKYHLVGIEVDDKIAKIHGLNTR